MWSYEDLGNLRINALHDDENDSLRSLLTVWKKRLRANRKRSLYFEGEQAFKDLGIALPPQLRNAQTCLGWPLQAVRKAAVRSQFQGLRLPGVDDPFELGELLERNRFGLEFSQANMDAGKLGVAFFSVAAGGEGEPDVLIQAHSAEHSAAKWDSRARRVSEALTIGEYDIDGDPSSLTLYLPWKIVYCRRVGGRWKVDRRLTRRGRAQVVPVPYDPNLGKVLGRSRITSPVMQITDMATRAYVRMEGNAELYSFPQIAAEGVDPAAFEGMGDDGKFRLAMNRIVALSKDEDGDTPTLKQFTQASMQPHADMLRTLAMAFCGETGIPPASLGVVADSNPSSEAAIRAGEHDLLIDVMYQNRYALNYAVSDIARMALMVREGLPEPPAESWRLSAKFADPEFRSTSANADAYVKLATANAGLADSPTLLGMLFDPDDVRSIQAHVKRSQSGSILERVMGGDRGAAAPDPEPTQDETTPVGGGDSDR